MSYNLEVGDIAIALDPLRYRGMIVRIASVDNCYNTVVIKSVHTNLEKPDGSTVRFSKRYLKLYEKPLPKVKVNIFVKKGWGPCLKKET